MNGNFLKWAAGLLATLFILAISGGVFYNQQMAAQIADNAARVKSLEDMILNYQANIRQAGSFNRDDAAREFHFRDAAIEKLERRIDLLENKK